MKLFAKNNPNILSDKIMLNEEYGEILMHFVEMSVIWGINAELSLTNAVEKFINTFSPDETADGRSILKEDT